jgi:hypothetical protein
MCEADETPPGNALFGINTLKVQLRVKHQAWSAQVVSNARVVMRKVVMRNARYEFPITSGVPHLPSLLRYRASCSALKLYQSWH